MNRDIDRIWVQYTEDMVSGSWRDDEQIDETASVEAYGAALAASLEEMHPDTEVVVEAGTDDRIRIDGETDHPAVDEVREAMARVLRRRDWLRYTQQGIREHLARGLDAETEDGTTASVHQVDLDGGRGYRLTWEQGALSRKKKETFETEDELLAAMVKIAPWNEWRPRSEGSASSQSR